MLPRKILKIKTVKYAFFNVLVNDSAHLLQRKVGLKYMHTCISNFLAFRGKWQENELFNQNMYNALIHADFFVWITARHGRAHKKRQKDTEETWFPTEEQREQAKSRFKIVFLGVDRDKTGRIGFFGLSGGTSGFGLQIGTVPTRSGRLASMQPAYGLPIQIATITRWLVAMEPPGLLWQT